MQLNIIEPTPDSHKWFHFLSFVYNFVYLSHICCLSTFSVYFLLHFITSYSTVLRPLFASSTSGPNIPSIHVLGHLC